MKRNIYFCLLSLTILSFFLSLNLLGDESHSPSSLEFLDMVRRNHPVDTWAMMSGEVSHKRRNDDNNSIIKRTSVETTPIKLSTRFTETRVFTKITIGKKGKEESDTVGEEGKEEFYTVGQAYNGDAPSVITSVLPEVSKLGKYGLKPEDLTMAFIYWKFEKELDKTTLKTMDCRVFLLSNPETTEQVKVYITADYYYPMKAEWFESEKKKSYKTYYINSFTKIDKLWAPNSFYLCGPGWRTNVEFDTVNLGFVKDGLPKGLF